MIRVGVDAICWHARLAARELTLAQVLDETAEAGGSFLQVALDYVREQDGGADAVVQHAHERGLALRATGGPIGRRYHDEDTGAAAAAVVSWLAEAQRLGSPTLMVYSGVYRPEIAGDPAATARELEHLGAVLDAAAVEADARGISILLENASDFTAEELGSLVEARSSSVGVFLDVTNPYNVWDDPVAAVARLAGRAPAGHVKDFALESLWTEDRYHRHGFSVLFRYPGEGVVDQPLLLGALVEATRGREFELSVEGLDSRPGVADQPRRLAASVALLRALLDAEPTPA